MALAGGGDARRLAGRRVALLMGAGLLVVGLVFNRLLVPWRLSRGPSRESVPDPARASEVEVRFEDRRVELEHRGFERHGDGAEGYRDGMGSPQGWPWLLERFAGAAAARTAG